MVDESSAGRRWACPALIRNAARLPRAFLALRRRRYAWIDDRMAALRRDFMPEMRGARCARPASTRASPSRCGRRSRKRAGCCSWPTGIPSSPAWSAGSICGPAILTPRSSRSQHPKLVGVRHIVQAEADDFLLDDLSAAGWRGLARHGLAYDILIYARQLPAAIDFARGLAGRRLVLDHLGKPDIRAGGFDGVAARSRSAGCAAERLCEAVGAGDRGRLERWTIETFTATSMRRWTLWP